MGITANSGPFVSFGLTKSASGGIQEYNEQRGPSVFDAGVAMADPRPAYTYQPGSPVTTKTWGWWKCFGRIDCKPGTFTAVTIATTQVPVAGTALTLQTVSSGCVTAGVVLHPSSNPQASVTVLAIDSTYATVPSGLAFGQSGTITCWDPQLALSRTISLDRASTLDDTAATYTIQGYDIYGYKLTETITGTSSQGSTNYQSVKAFKYIESITPAGTLGTTGLTVRPTNTYGLPLAAREGWQFQAWLGLSSNQVQLTAQTSLLLFGSTITNTATSPDVRGTWASTNTSSNSSNFLFVQVRPRAQDIQNMASTYLSTAYWLWLGADQYSS